MLPPLLATALLEVEASARVANFLHRQDLLFKALLYLVHLRSLPSLSSGPPD